MDKLTDETQIPLLHTLANPSRDYKCAVFVCAPQDYGENLKAFYKNYPDADIWDIIKGIHVTMVKPEQSGLGIIPANITAVPQPTIVCCIYFSVPKEPESYIASAHHE